MKYRTSRGGRRLGAGRKSYWDIPARKLTVTLPTDILEALPELPMERSYLLERILRHHLKKKGKL